MRRRSPKKGSHLCCYQTSLDRDLPRSFVAAPFYLLLLLLLFSLFVWVFGSGDEGTSRKGTEQLSSPGGGVFQQPDGLPNALEREKRLSRGDEKGIYYRKFS